MEVLEGMEERVQFRRRMEAVRVQDQIPTGAADGEMMDIGGDFSFDYARGRVPGALYGSGHSEEWSTHRRTEEVRCDELAEAGRVEEACGGGPEDGPSLGAEDESEETMELMEEQGMSNPMPTEKGAPGPRPMQEVGGWDPRLTNSELVGNLKGRRSACRS